MPLKELVPVSEIERAFEITTNNLMASELGYEGHLREVLAMVAKRKSLKEIDQFIQEATHYWFQRYQKVLAAWHNVLYK